MPWTSLLVIYWLSRDVAIQRPQLRSGTSYLGRNKQLGNVQNCLTPDHTALDK